MGEGGKRAAEVVVEHVERAGELEDRVVAAFRLRAVGGLAGAAEGGPGGAFGDVDHLHRRRFADDGELVIRGVAAGEVLAAKLPGFLAHEGDEVDGDRRLRLERRGLAERPQHGGHRPLGVRGPAAPDPAVAEVAAERVDAHAVDADGVEVRAEQNPRAAVARGEAGDQVGSARFDLVHDHLRAERLQPTAEEHRDLLFVGGIGAGGIVRIDRRDADEVLQKGDDIGWHGGMFRFLRPRGKRGGDGGGVGLDKCPAVVQGAGNVRRPMPFSAV